MSDFKIGDAVRTPRGDGLVQDVNDTVITVFFLDGAACLSHDGNGITRLVPDTGLAEEVRALVEHAEMYTTEEGGPELWVRAVDLEEALGDEPEPFLPNRVTKMQEPYGTRDPVTGDHAVHGTRDVPHPSEQVTRDDLADALYFVRKAIKNQDPESLTSEINRLWTQRKAEPEL